jgi:opacity protein-like surface antigen
MLRTALTGLHGNAGFHRRREMKHVLCAMMILMLVSSVVYAKEIGPGTISVSGATGLDFSKTTTKIEGMDDLKTDAFSVELNGEYYIMNNVGVGLILMYESLKEDVAMSDDRYETSSMMVGPQVVYNVSVNEQVSVPVFAAFGSVSVDNGTDDYSGWAWAIGGGVRYFVTDRFSFDGYIFYDSMSLEDGIKMDVTDFAGRVGISIYLGGE